MGAVKSKNSERMRLGSVLPLASMALASPWTWTCEPSTSFCTRQLLTEGTPQQTEAQCRLSCAPSTLLWPSPTSATFEEGSEVATFDPSNIITEKIGEGSGPEVMLCLGLGERTRKVLLS